MSFFERIKRIIKFFRRLLLGTSSKYPTSYKAMSSTDMINDLLYNKKPLLEKYYCTVIADTTRYEPGKRWYVKDITEENVSKYSYDELQWLYFEVAGRVDAWKDNPLFPAAPSRTSPSIPKVVPPWKDHEGVYRDLAASARAKETARKGAYVEPRSPHKNGESVEEENKDIINRVLHNGPALLNQPYDRIAVAKILNIPDDARSEEARAAYKKLALAVHPDHNQGNKENADKAFNIVKEAYDAYDKMLQSPRPGPRP